MDTTLGQRIRELRDGKDISLREFARMLGGLSAAFLSDIELNRRFPSDDVLAKMAPILGTTIEDLQQYDTRVPIQGLKRMVSENPAFGLAFRMMMESEVTPEELIKLAKSKGEKS